MKKRSLFWLVPMLAALTVPAYAGHRDDGSSRFEHRIERQRDRIRHGVRAGELTRHEAKALRKQQRHITRLERRFERDGRLDRHERRTLRRKLDGASRRIARLKNNDRQRDYARHRLGGHGRPSAQHYPSGYHHVPRYRGKHVTRHYHYDGKPQWSFVLSLSDTW
jgi:hypothetical protein